MKHSSVFILRRSALFLMNTRRSRARSIWINRIEDTPKTVLNDAFLQDFLADVARARMTDAILIASLTRAENIHRCTAQLLVSRLLDHIDLSMDRIVRITWTE